MDVGADKFWEGSRRWRELPSEGFSPPRPTQLAEEACAQSWGRELGRGRGEGGEGTDSLEKLVWAEGGKDRGAGVGRQVGRAGPSAHCPTCAVVTHGPEARVRFWVCFGLLPADRVHPGPPLWASEEPPTP